MAFQLNEDDFAIQYPEWYKQSNGGGTGGTASSLASLSPWGTVASAAGNVIGAGVDWFANRGKRKQHKQDRRAIEGMIGKDVINPMRTANMGLNYIRDDTRKFGDIIDRNLGLDTGQGMGALYGRSLGLRLKSLSDLIALNDQLKGQRDAQLRMGLLADSRS